ncbi:MAG: hypothetical protein DMD98_13620 [Candidatus Rokuibacteriota bacterium]|nr:MAG: hypothetical protein AUI15_21355 [Actinobacteria bacterium 13_2_20CM_2_66_6]PYN32774.1 MAG: hypothetical protein DMD98_13620 [Candidatus Rokubacteria bacterium]
MKHDDASFQHGDVPAMELSRRRAGGGPMDDRVPTRSGFDLARDVWSRRKWLAILVFVGLFAPALTVAKSVPNVYRSTATFIVEPQKVSEAFVRLPEASIRSFWTNELETRLHTISQETLSRARLEELITRFDLYRDLRRVSPEAAVERMRRDIKLEPREVGQTGVWGATIAFTLSYRGTNPKIVAEITNTLSSFYVEKNLSIREHQASATTEFLRAQLEAAKAKLDEQERRVREFKQRSGDELPQQVAANLAILMRLNDQVRLNSDRHLRATERRMALVKQLGDMGSPSVPDSPAARLARLKVELIELRERFTDKYPEVVRVKAEIAALERALAQADPNGRSVGERETPADPTQLRLKQELSKVDAELKGIEAEDQQVRRDIAAYQRRVESAPEREQQLQALSRDYEAARELHLSLLKRYEDAQLGERMEEQKGAQFRILDPAIPAKQPAGPNRLLLLVYGLMLSLGVAAGAVVLAERLDTSIHTIDDLRARIPVPVLVSIPRMITGSDVRRRRARVALATVSVTLGLALIVGASAYLGHGNEQLALVLARGR